MKFFEKVRNMFTEEVEEDDDVKVEQIKNDVTKVKIESPNSKDEETETVEDELDYMPHTRESKPIFFDDKDFRDLNLEPKREKVEVEDKDLYGIKRHEEKEPVEKKIFKPTPIISPVYGVLDKNYHKEDIVSRSDTMVEKTIEESPIDTIRNKAYGTLEDELENTLFGSNSILFRKDEPKEEPKEQVEAKEVEEKSLDGIIDDISKELDELLVQKSEDEELKEESKGMPEEKTKAVEDEDLLGFIDSTLYKEGDE